jgi:hypothetical protein
MQTLEPRTWNSSHRVYKTNSLCSIFLHRYPTTNWTNSMEHSPSWEANRSSATQEIPRDLCNPKVYFRVHRRPPPVPILIKLHPVHAPIPFLSDPF